MNYIENVGFDIDGVLMDYYGFCLKYGKKFFKIKKDSDVPNINGDGILEMFNCTEEEEKKFWTKNGCKYNNKYIFFTKPRPEVKYYFEKIKQEGKKIYLITSRVETTKNTKTGKFMRWALKIWLKKNKIPYDELIFCDYEKGPEDKINAIKKNNIQVFVDDNVANVKEICKVVKTFLMVTGSNILSKDINSDITKVDNLEMIFDEIKNIESNAPKIERKTLSEQNLMDFESKKAYLEGINKTYNLRHFDIEKFVKGENGCKYVMKRIQPIFNFVYRPKIINPEKFPIENIQDGVILVSNHLHSFDPLLIMSAIKDKNFHLLAKSSIEVGMFSKLFQKVGTYFVDGASKTSKDYSLEKSIQVLNNNGNVIIYPESHRNKNDDWTKLGDFSYGAVTMAQITGHPIIPFAINKDYRLFNKLAVIIGKPFYVKPEDKLVDANVALKMIIENLLEELLKEIGVSEDLSIDSKNKRM